MNKAVTGCKLSRRTTQELATSSSVRAEVESLVRSCRAAGKRVVLEGIEHAGELELVHSAFAWDKVLYKWRWLVPFTWLLERLVQLPSTHRAHHAELDEHGKPPHHNFAQLLFIWDTLFGTANFTHDRYPERYGIPNDPGDPWCVQLWWPFCRSRKADSEYR